MERLPLTSALGTRVEGIPPAAAPAARPFLGFSPVILRNLAAKSASEAVIKIARLLFLALAARWLGRAGFGAWSYALAVGAVLAQIAEMGLSFHLAREIAREPKGAPDLLAGVLRAKALLYLLALPALAAAGFALSRDADPRLIWLVSGALLFGSLVELGNYVFRGFQRLGYEAVANLLHVGIASAAGLTAVRLGMGPIGLAGGALLGAGASLAYSASRVHRRFVPLPRLRDLDPRRGSLGALRASFPIGAAILLSILYFRIDVLFLGRYRGAETVGLYAAAYRIVESLLFLPAIFLAAVFPAFSERTGRETARLRPLFRASLASLLAAAGILSLVLLLFAGPILRLLYGEAYGPAATTLRILAPAVLLLFANYALTHFLIALGKAKTNLAIAAVCLGVNATANLLLIPRYGMTAAAATTLLTEVVLFALALPAVLRGIQRIGS